MQLPDRILGDSTFQNILCFRVSELSLTLFGWYFGTRNKWEGKEVHLLMCFEYKLDCYYWSLFG